MKNIASVAVMILLHCTLYAQVTEYFTADLKKTKDPDKASYYRTITYKTDGQPSGVVTDHYMNGQLKWKGVILHIDKNGNETRNGWCTWFHPNGRFQQQSFYIQGKLDSTTYYWNEDGEATGEEDYRNNILHGAWIRYFPGGKPHIVALYENGRIKDDFYLEYDEYGMASIIYPEYFDQPAKWTLFNGGEYGAIIKDRKLILSTKTSNYRTFGYKYVQLEATNNFSIETTVTPNKSGRSAKSHGLIWGVKDVSNYDYFIISDDGAFKTGYVQKGVDVTAIPWTNTAALRKGNAVNQIKVLKTGNQYSYVINGQVVGSGVFQPLMGNYTGVTLASGIETVAFEHFVVQKEAGTMASGENTSPVNGAADWDFSGSGVLIDRNGFIATNEHVIKGAKKIEVEFTRNGNKHTFRAEVVKADANQDIAILRINDSRYESFKPAAIPYGITNKLLDIGSTVFALGYPEITKLGSNIKFTDGKISAQTGTMDNPYWYQITVPIQHGNSGGPLFDNDGNLVGITNAGFTGAMDNVAYAIKSELLLKLLTSSFPGQYVPPLNKLKDKPLTEKIKVLKDFVPLIKAKM